MRKALHSAYSYLHGNTLTNTLLQAFFITPLGDTGGETAPRRLSFFLEFWVFSLSFEFFLEF